MSGLSPAVSQPKPRHPWNRQEGESDKAFAAFVVYREQVPPRSVKRAALALDRGDAVLREWSSKHHWVERAAEYTNHLDSIAIAANEQDIARRRREENDEVFAIASAIRNTALARLVGVKEEDGTVKVVPIHPNDLDADDVIRWFESSTKASRLALGMPTDMTGSITVRLDEVEKLLRSFLASAQKRMEPEAYGALVRECYASIREQLGG